MKNLIIIPVLILTLCFDLSGQEDIQNKFSISLSSGMAIPIGSFGNMDIINSAIYTPEEVQNPWVIGIDKSKSGFAEPGLFLNLEMKYLLNQSIGLLFQTGYSSNSVATEVITQFLTGNYGNQIFKHDNYEIVHFAPGIGYQKKLGNFNLGAGVFSGLALTKYPYYESILLFSTTDPPLKWAHDGDRPNLKALFFGTSINLLYQKNSKFNWGLEVSYQSSNFDYSMKTRVIPGSSPNPEFNDTLKTKNLNIGLKLQYNLSKKK
jgi:hypothetical protein